MVALIARGKAVQNLHGLLRGRLLHLHPAKTALQGGIFLDVGAEFLVGGGTDHLYLAPGQHGLEDAGCVDGTFCRTGTHNGVELVHEQDGRAIPHQFFQKVLEPFLKVAAVLGARHKAGHIQCQQAAALQRPRHTVRGDALGKALGQCRLAYARLPHEAGVILLAAAQDLHHAVQLRFPAEHRVQLPVGGFAGEVAAVFIAGAAAPGHTGRNARLGRQNELPGQLAAFPHGLGERQAHGGQQQACRAAVVLQHGAEQVFWFGAVQMGVLGPNDGVVHRAAQVRRKGIPVQMQGRAAAALGQLTAHVWFANLLVCQKTRGCPVVLLQDRQQQVAGIRFFTAQIPGQFHCTAQQMIRLPREALIAAKAHFLPDAHCMLLVAKMIAQEV